MTVGGRGKMMNLSRKAEKLNQKVRTTVLLLILITPEEVQSIVRINYPLQCISLVIDNLINLKKLIKVFFICKHFLVQCVCA